MSSSGYSADYYKVPSPKKTIEAMDIIEDRQMNYAQGNILKVAWTFNVGRHDGTSAIRDLEKVIYFANKELARLKKD